MSLCSKCSVETNRKGYCKTCHQIYVKQHYQDNKEKYLNRAKVARQVYRDRMRALIWEHLITHNCIDCGESDPVVLDFDHVLGVKSFSISTAINRPRETYSEKDVLEEIQKCVIRCSNCHRRKTAKERNTWRIGVKVNTSLLQSEE